MKAFGLLLLLVAVGAVSYFYAYEPIVGFIGLEKPKVESVAETQPTIVKVEEPPPAPPKVEAPKPEPPKPEPMPTPPPMPVVLAPMDTTPKPDADGFTPPVFQPIEDVVKGWMEIPKSAFNPPRPVKVMKSLEFVRVINGNKIGSKMPAGGTAYATGQEGLTLMVATSPDPGAPSAQVALDDTDLKAVLTAAYENWKVNMTEYKRRQHLFAKESAGRVQEAKKGGAPVVVAGAPKKNADGTYDVLLTSMKAGEVTEITPTNVKKWGDALVEKIDGKDYFTIIVDYTTKTMFGDFDTQAQARIFNGKVEKWIYTGSGEVVP
ncbi:MAG: hypothetical protein ACAH88_10925 [Roseimicrobium sp.]